MSSILNLEFFGYLFAGIAGVGNMVLWGIYGDLVVEKFETKKIYRSILFGIIGTIYIYLLDNQLPLFIVALCSITIERFLTEMYKALWRKESQDKYVIPSNLGIQIDTRFRRILFILIAILFFVFLPSYNAPISGLVLGILAGVIVALGGALKDAPYEGFKYLKFFRSPIIASCAGILLEFWFPNIDSLFIFLSIFGLERIISELYKKIICGRVPGKFKPLLERNEQWMSRRKYLLIPYSLSLLILLALFFYV